MNGVIDFESDQSDLVEIDPTGRYGRYNEILGKGASKTVYRAFDEYEGIEVAWNQVKLNDFLQSPEELERLYCEIHLLKTLKHKNIMKFYASWVDAANRNINFVTEMFTSGTLRQYRQKHKRVNIRAVKHWCRQILKGLHYLHSRHPPVIHRDLKCDNIFVNGNQGEIKIGDLGLAAILRKSHAARCVGTPEFMAPEVYAEEYNELVDIYAFGMCILEMVTFEYPYSECTHPAQIYKKVVSGKKPDSFYKVKDPEIREFVEKCLATVSHRLSARELLDDPFLQIDDYATSFGVEDCCSDFDEFNPISRQPFLNPNHSSSNGYHSSSSLVNEYSNYFYHDDQKNELEYHPNDYEATETDFFTCPEDGHSEVVDITIKGKRREDDGIFLRLRIADKEGRIRNIYFPFDLEDDTALRVAAEMVAELEITDQDVTKIAEMIDGEIVNLVPGWKGTNKANDIEEFPNDTSNNDGCHNSPSDNSLLQYITSDGPGSKNLQVLECSRHGCGGAVHGRFEEITYQFEGSDQCETENTAPPPPVSSRSDGVVHYTDKWAQHEGHEINSNNNNSTDNQLQEPVLQSTTDADIQLQEPVLQSTTDADINEDKYNAAELRDSLTKTSSDTRSLAEDYENEIKRELRWLKAKYQMQLRELKDKQLGGVVSKPDDNKEQKKDHKSSPLSSSLSFKPKTTRRTRRSSREEEKSGAICRDDFPSILPVSSSSKLKRANQAAAAVQVTAYNTCSPEHIVTAQSFYTGALLPNSLHRATSLPVDAIDV